MQVHSLVQDALAKGATAVLGGKPDPRGGNFYQPTLLADVKTDMRCSLEEIFGPVATVFKYTAFSLNHFHLLSTLSLAVAGLMTSRHQSDCCSIAVHK